MLKAAAKKGPETGKHKSKKCEIIAAGYMIANTWDIIARSHIIAV